MKKSRNNIGKTVQVSMEERFFRNHDEWLYFIREFCGFEEVERATDTLEITVEVRDFTFTQ